jgi:hypothetical protein
MMIATLVSGYRMPSVPTPNSRAGAREKAYQKVRIIPLKLSARDSPTTGLAAEDASRGVANIENVPLLLLFTQAYFTSTHASISFRRPFVLLAVRLTMRWPIP